MGKPEKATCWYCQTNVERPSRAVCVQMYGNVRAANEHTLRGIQYKKAFEKQRVHVPRCKNCADVHEKQSGIVMICAGIPLLGVIGYAVYLYVSGQAEDMVGLVLGTLCGGGVLAAIGAFVGAIVSSFSTPSSVRDVGDYKEFPPIRERLYQGWKFGNQPPPN